MQRTYSSWLLATLLVFGLALGGCDLFGSDGGGGGEDGGDTGDGQAAITWSLDAHHA